MNQNRRRFQRIFFSADAEITGFFRLDAPYSRIAVAVITDLNAKGIGIRFHKDECPQLVSGDRLTILKITEPRLAFICGPEMKIRWVINHRSLEHMAMGCEFDGISPDFMRQIDELVKTWPSGKAETEKTE
ncbi:MAG: PilZ domain-containing protein [Desulfococcaceae bacterium]|jgi:hypothetical protein|nr:PilZ domain-containing protein [Desulfococcaceae bacterium]